MGSPPGVLGVQRGRAHFALGFPIFFGDLYPTPGFTSKDVCTREQFHNYVHLYLNSSPLIALLGTSLFFEMGLIFSLGGRKQLKSHPTIFFQDSY